MSKPTWLHRFAAFVAAFYLHLVGRSSFVETWDHPASLSYRRKKQPVIYGFWHNSQVFLAYHHRHEPVNIMVSQSKDGEYIAQVMKWMGLNAVRGSSSRGGTEAFLELVQHAEAGEQIGFTPDGPRGPVHTVQPGIVLAAQKLGLPIVAAHALPRRRLVFNSWDKFMVPLPLSYIAVSHGKPLFLADNLSEEAAKEKVRTALNENQETAARAAASAPSNIGSLWAVLLLGIYTVGVHLLLPVLIPFFVLRHGIKKSAAGIKDRLGFSSPKHSGKKRLWFHAASLGEWQALKPLLDGMGASAQWDILITTSASDARNVLRRDHSEMDIYLAPLDLPWIIGPWIRRWNPDAVFLVETEMWPNLMEAAVKQRVPIFVVNGRLSEKGLRHRRPAYQLAKRLLRRVSWFFVRTPEDKANYEKLGAPAERIEVTGNLKIDNLSVLPLEKKNDARRALWGSASGTVIAAGSTWGEEEKMILKLLERPASADIRLVIAPRRPSRFDDVARLLEQTPFSFDRWSKIKDSRTWASRILLVDTLGDLKKMYEASDAAFIGGSFEKRGGQNPLEAAAASNALVFGSSMHNFSKEAEQLLKNGAAFQAEEEEALLNALAKLAADEPLRRQMSTKAAQVLLNNQGVAKKVLASLKEMGIA